MEAPKEFHSSSKYYRALVFVVGIVATIAYRIIVVLNHYSSVLVEVSWYVGTVGFIWYFAHRYRVQKKYSQIITERNLDEKICKNELTGDDCKALAYILQSLESSKAKWNSIAIFSLSIAALIYATTVNILKLIKQ